MYNNKSHRRRNLKEKQFRWLWCLKSNSGLLCRQATTIYGVRVTKQMEKKSKGGAIVTWLWRGYYLKEMVHRACEHFWRDISKTSAVVAGSGKDEARISDKNVNFKKSRKWRGREISFPLSVITFFFFFYELSAFFL